MANQLRRLNPSLFSEIVAFGLMDLGWGIATLLLPTASLTQQQSAVITGYGVKILGAILVLKALALLSGCFLAGRYQILQKLMILGFILWGSMAILSLLAFIGGRGTSVFGLMFFAFILFRRWVVFSYVPPKEVT